MNNYIPEILMYVISVNNALKTTNTAWQDTQINKGLNFNTKRIRDIVKETSDNNALMSVDFFKEVTEYREFINDGFLNDHFEFYGVRNRLSSMGVLITKRTKHHNSIISKVLTYRFIKGVDNGAVSINKCLNDLMGFRLILPGNFSNREEKIDFIEKLKNGISDLTENKIKIRDASKSTDHGNYEAIHITLLMDNFTFPWEIQIWCDADVKNNMTMHRIHKQSYVSWEMGGKSISVD